MILGLARALVGYAACVAGGALVKAGARLAGAPGEAPAQDPGGGDAGWLGVVHTEESLAMVEEGMARPPRPAPTPLPWDETLLVGSAAWQRVQGARGR